jgi:hypothetical protein
MARWSRLPLVGCESLEALALLFSLLTTPLDAYHFIPLFGFSSKTTSNMVNILNTNGDIIVLATSGPSSRLRPEGQVSRGMVARSGKTLDLDHEMRATLIKF